MIADRAAEQHPGGGPPPRPAVRWSSRRYVTSGDCSGVHYGVENEVGCLEDH